MNCVESQNFMLFFSSATTFLETLDTYLSNVDRCVSVAQKLRWAGAKHRRLLAENAIFARINSDFMMHHQRRMRRWKIFCEARELEICSRLLFFVEVSSRMLDFQNVRSLSNSISSG